MSRTDTKSCTLPKGIQDIVRQINIVLTVANFEFLWQYTWHKQLRGQVFHFGSWLQMFQSMVTFPFAPAPVMKWHIMVEGHVMAHLAMNSSNDYVSDELVLSLSKYLSIDKIGTKFSLSWCSGEDSFILKTQCTETCRCMEKSIGQKCLIPEVALTPSAHATLEIYIPFL